MSAQGPPNNDQRPLPWGFVARFDQQYGTWYYVNTQQNPPRPSWIHPADEFGGGGGGDRGMGGYPQQQQQWQQHGGSGFGGGHHDGGGGGYYGGQQQQKSGGGGMGTAGAVALGAGAGIVGGVLIADAIDDRQEEAYAEGYEDGGGGDDE